MKKPSKKKPLLNEQTYPFTHAGFTENNSGVPENNSDVLVGMVYASPEMMARGRSTQKKKGFLRRLFERFRK